MDTSCGVRVALTDCETEMDWTPEGRITGRVKATDNRGERRCAGWRTRSEVKTVA